MYPPCFVGGRTDVSIIECCGGARLHVESLPSEDRNHSLNAIYTFSAHSDLVVSAIRKASRRKISSEFPPLWACARVFSCRRNFLTVLVRRNVKKWSVSLGSTVTTESKMGLGIAWRPTNGTVIGGNAASNVVFATSLLRTKPVPTSVTMPAVALIAYLFTVSYDWDSESESLGPAGAVV